MKAWRGVRLLVAICAAPGVVAAQNPQCSPFTGNAANLCNAAVDGVTIYHPVVGQVVSGGNPELGRVGTLGGLGHFSVTLRANASQVNFPDQNYSGSGSVVAAGSDVVVPEPTVDLAVGVFGGMESGFLALDLLGTAHLLPGNVQDVTIDPGASRVGDVALGWGYGLRLGLVGNRDGHFALSTTVMRRSIPRFSYTSGSYSFSSDLDATNLRAVLGWHASIISIGFGAGVDWYRGAATATFADPSLFVARTVSLDLNARRFLGFADLALVFPVVRISAEAGYQLGEDNAGITTVFDGYDPTRGLFFASGGLTLSF